MSRSTAILFDVVLCLLDLSKFWILVALEDDLSECTSRIPHWRILFLICCLCFMAFSKFLILAPLDDGTTEWISRCLNWRKSSLAMLVCFVGFLECYHVGNIRGRPDEWVSLDFTIAGSYFFICCVFLDFSKFLIWGALQ